MRNYGLVSKIIYCPIFVRFPAKKQAVSEAFAISRQKKKALHPARILDSFLFGGRGRDYP